jgi:hypothetical protein
MNTAKLQPQPAATTPEEKMAETRIRNLRQKEKRTPLTASELRLIETLRDKQSLRRRMS